MSGFDCNASAGEEEKGGFGLYWPDSIAKFVSSRPVSDCLKNSDEQQ